MVLLSAYVMELGNSVILAADKLAGDTNTLVIISSRDRVMRHLAGEINRNLKELRRQRLRFVQGDLELKSAVANISHDLRTPLTAISSYLDLLDKTEKRIVRVLNRGAGSVSG